MFMYVLKLQYNSYPLRFWVKKKKEIFYNSHERKMHYECPIHSSVIDNFKGI